MRLVSDWARRLGVMSALSLGVWALGCTEAEVNTDATLTNGEPEAGSTTGGGTDVPLAESEFETEPLQDIDIPDVPPEPEPLEIEPEPDVTPLPEPPDSTPVPEETDTTPAPSPPQPEETQPEPPTAEEPPDAAGDVEPADDEPPAPPKPEA